MHGGEHAGKFFCTQLRAKRSRCLKRTRLCNLQLWFLCFSRNLKNMSGWWSCNLIRRRGCSRSCEQWSVAAVSGSNRSKELGFRVLELHWLHAPRPAVQQSLARKMLSSRICDVTQLCSTSAPSFLLPESNCSQLCQVLASGGAQLEEPLARRDKRICLMEFILSPQLSTPWGESQ